MDWKRWRRAPEPEIDADEVVRKLEALDTLLKSPGWDHLKGQLVGEANECVAKWTRGGLGEEEGHRLASRIATIGWVLDLPSMHLADYGKLLERDASETPSDPDEAPIIAPHEKE